MVLAVATCSPEPEPEPEPEHQHVWPGQCAQGVEAGAPTRVAWSVIERWARAPYYRALPDGAVVTVGQMLPESTSEESWIDVRVFEPDGSERWADRYYGYIGYDTWVSGVSVDSTGDIHVSGLDAYGEISLGWNDDAELLQEQLLIRWSAAGQRRFRSRIEPCGVFGAGLGIAADGRVHAVRHVGDHTKVCIHAYARSGESEPVFTPNVPDHEGALELATQWDGSFSISSRTTEPETIILAHYGPNGEQSWARRDPTLPSNQYYHLLLPGLIGDGRTAVSYQVQDELGAIETEVWMVDSEGEISWRVDGVASGVDCANEVIVRQPSGSFTLHDPQDGRVLHEWSIALPGNSDQWQEFIPSPDGAVYVGYPLDDGYAVARLEPESAD
jgi:hypothetical protein